MHFAVCYVDLKFFALAPFEMRKEKIEIDNGMNRASSETLFTFSILYALLVILWLCRKSRSTGMTAVQIDVLKCLENGQSG